MIPDFLENGSPLPGREKWSRGDYSLAGSWVATSCCGAHRRAFIVGVIFVFTAAHSCRWVECAASRVVCPYHAWEYNSSGQCVHIPSHPGQPPPLKARAQTYQAREHYGVVWVCVGEPAG